MNINYKAVLIKPTDNVATALECIPVDSIVTIKCKEKEVSIRVLKEIEFGHKFAIVPILKGETIVKYGDVIGRAIHEIEQGNHVHIHNIEGLRGRGDQVAINK
ncbi:MAG: UxaA family hydrolase [Bacilli bacterium]|nr:UxaA family hydrolase [Bacilli bacterium]